jgi:glycosyltransferase involved in cell wall biosynthesis
MIEHIKMEVHSPRDSTLSSTDLRRKRKIAVICYEYPPIGGGGGRAAREVSRTLASAGHDLRVYTAAHGFKTGAANEAGVLINRLFAFRTRKDRCSVAEMGAYVAAAFVPALADLRAWRPDILHAHFAVPSGALAMALSRVLRIPYALTAQLGDVPGAMGPRTDGLFRILNPAIRPIWENASGLSACSSFAARLAEKAYGLPVQVIYNGIDMPESDRAIPSALATRRFVYAGRFDPQKNLMLLIEALAELPTDRAWRLDMIGDGPEGAKLRDAVNRHGLDARVHFHGWITPEAAREQLENSEVFVMTSRQEGLPLSALEALRAGLAILGSDIGGLADVLKHDINGLTFPEGDRSGLTRALDEMIAGSSLDRMRKESHALRHQFDIRIIANEYLDWIEQALVAHPVKRSNATQ